MATAMSAGTAPRDASARHHRFSLLHLDEGEDYVGDFVGLCKVPSEAAARFPAKAVETMSGRAHSKLRGRIRLLSRSLLFDPDDRDVPMLKFPLAAVTSIDAKGGVHAAFELVCSRCEGKNPRGKFLRTRSDDINLDLGVSTSFRVFLLYFFPPSAPTTATPTIVWSTPG